MNKMKRQCKRAAVEADGAEGRSGSGERARWECKCVLKSSNRSWIRAWFQLFGGVIVHGVYVGSTHIRLVDPPGKP